MSRTSQQQHPASAVQVATFESLFPVERYQQRQRYSLGEALLHDDGALWALQRSVAEARFALLVESIQRGKRLIGEPTVRVIIEVEQESISDTVPEGLALTPRQRQFGVRALRVEQPMFAAQGYAQMADGASE